MLILDSDSLTTCTKNQKPEVQDQYGSAYDSFTRDFQSS